MVWKEVHPFRKQSRMFGEENCVTAHWQVPILHPGRRCLVIHSSSCNFVPGSLFGERVLLAFCLMGVLVCWGYHNKLPKNADVQGQEKTDISAQAERGNLPFLYLFALLRASADWKDPPMLERAICFTQYTNSNAHLFRKHPRRHTLFLQLSGHPSNQLSWHTKLTISVIVFGDGAFGRWLGLDVWVKGVGPSW